MEANSLFDFPKMEITKPIRLIELFGGIGSQAMALRDIGANFEHHRLVEFDKYAVASYNAVHDTRHTTHDIRQIHAADLGITDKDKYTYLMTYSFPCTDLSVAGKMKGMSKAEWEQGNSTRSGLLWEVERILKECTKEQLPDVLLMENVPQVHAEQNMADFEAWQSFLRSKGYVNHWKDLNAKDYGIPQNRDRCFMVSILSDEFVDFEWPKPIPLTTVMRDFLEESVDEKYYINSEKAQKLIAQLIESGELPEQNRTEQNSLSDSSDFVNNRICKRQSEVRSSIPEDRLCKYAPGERLQRTGELCENERSYTTVLISKQGTHCEGKTDVATCLMARDYKGMGNQSSNGVIEW